MSKSLGRVRSTVDGVIGPTVCVPRYWLVHSNVECGYVV